MRRFHPHCLKHSTILQPLLIGMGVGAASITPKVTLNIGTISGGLKNNMVPVSYTHLTLPTKA